MKTLLAIAVSGAIGSVLRYLVGRGVQRLAHVAFPVGTLVVNVVGCVLVGVLARYFINDETTPVVHAALVVGLCGGFTTYSTFSLETLGLMMAGDWERAFAYVAVSIGLCLAGTALGYQLVLRR